MKIIFLSEEDSPSIESMRQAKCRILTPNTFDLTENIWVHIDDATNKMYFANNHAGLAMMTVPSWGWQFDATSTLLLDDYIGKGPDDIVMTLHHDTKEKLSEFVDKDGQFDRIRYNEWQNELHNSKNEEE